MMHQPYDNHEIGEQFQIQAQLANVPQQPPSNTFSHNQYLSNLYSEPCQKELYKDSSIFKNYPHNYFQNPPCCPNTEKNCSSYYAEKRETFQEAVNCYEMGRHIGSGSFGIVCKARCRLTGEQVAIKRVLQDPRYKNRELDVMKELDHPNIVKLKNFFYTESLSDNNNDGEEESSNQIFKQPQRFLNVVMEYIPSTVYRVLKSYVRNNQPLPIILVRLYIYQLCRSVGYLHSLGICHRDIKPQNLLIDLQTHTLKLCDFGSAKRLLLSEHSVAYICSRFYRAPELMLGATDYTTAVDLWSIGCVLGELLLGKPLFTGETSVDQLVKIIQILGTPNQRQMLVMNPNYQEFKFPDVRPKSWKQVMQSAIGDSSQIPSEAYQLLSALLRYEPGWRIKAYELLKFRFFDPLRDPNCTLPEGQNLPELFNFSPHELHCMSPECRSKAIPNWLY